PAHRRPRQAATPPFPSFPFAHRTASLRFVGLPHAHRGAPIRGFPHPTRPIHSSCTGPEREPRVASLLLQPAKAMEPPPGPGAESEAARPYRAAIHWPNPAPPPTRPHPADPSAESPATL